VAEDYIDAKLPDWKRELPDLDLTVEGIVQRIDALHGYLKRSMSETLAEHGLKLGEWSVLGQLRRVGPPYRLSPGELTSHGELSSGAMTNRLDRLEEAGLVRRLPNPDDRRSVLVELTDAGHQAWEGLADDQGVKEANVVSGTLSGREREQLNNLLRRLMIAFEQHGPPRKGKAKASEASSATDPPA
jgi:DNA-binding MarR family transcriptional regulator